MFGALSLCKKAGKLAAGFDAVKEKALRGEAALVLLAVDASPGTQKRVRAVCQPLCPVESLPYTQNELASITRKPVGVLAVTSKDLAALCSKALAAAPPDEEEPV